LMPRIPVVMATQHPDSAKKYLSIQQEVDEALDVLINGCDNGLSYDEYNIDYEDKLTPYHQPSQIVAKVLSQGIIPGNFGFRISNFSYPQTARCNRLNERGGIKKLSKKSKQSWDLITHKCAPNRGFKQLSKRGCGR